MSTTGDILNTDQQEAFERYMHTGGGFAGVHAASDTEYTWPYYGQMLGALLPQPPERHAAGDDPHRGRRRALHHRDSGRLDAQ